MRGARRVWINTGEGKWLCRQRRHQSVLKKKGRKAGSLRFGSYLPGFLIKIFAAKIEAMGEHRWPPMGARQGYGQKLFILRTSALLSSTNLSLGPSTSTRPKKKGGVLADSPREFSASGLAEETYWQTTTKNRARPLAGTEKVEVTPVAVSVSAAVQEASATVGSSLVSRR